MSTEITPDCSRLLYSLHAVLIAKGKIKLMQQMWFYVNKFYQPLMPVLLESINIKIIIY